MTKHNERDAIKIALEKLEHCDDLTAWETCREELINLFEPFREVEENRYVNEKRDSSAMPLNFVLWADIRTVFDDAITDCCLTADQMEAIIDGRGDGPILTPVKQKQSKPEENFADETLDLSVKKTLFAKPKVKDESEELVQEETDSIPEEVPVDLRLSLMEEYKSKKVVQLREVCRKQNLDTHGKKQDLVERIVNKTISLKQNNGEYGSPRMRNSYQTAMASPLPISSKATNEQPKSLRSNTSSTASIRSTTSTASTRSNASLRNFKKTASSSRFRSPSPSSQPKSLPRTPRVANRLHFLKSFKSRIKETMQNSAFASPRPWSKTPSKTNLLEKAKTPSRTEIDQRDAERERKMKERRELRDREEQRKREEKARHAEEIRRKKQKIEDEKKSKAEKIFSLGAKAKKPNMKQKRAELAEKQAKEKAIKEQKAKEEERQRFELEQKKREKEEAERRRLEAQRQVLTPQRQNPPSYGYDMTPHGEDKWVKHPSTSENYNIEDLGSSDDTDDDEAPRKAIPAWAQKSAFKSALSRQYKNRKHPYEIFEAVDPNRNVILSDIFDRYATENAKRRYERPRASSACWMPMVQPRDVPDRTLNLEESVFPIEEPNLVSH